MADDERDSEDRETVLWRHVVETLLARGAAPSEAIDGANLVLQSYRRQRHAEQAAAAAREEAPPETAKGSRRRVK